MNGPLLSGTSRSAVELVRKSDVADVIHYDRTVTSTASFVAGPGPAATLSLQGTGTVPVTTGEPSSACRVKTEGFMEVGF